MEGVRLLVGDTRTVVRDGLRRLLEDRPGWRVVGEVATGRAAVQAAVALQPDVAILETGLAQLDGVDAARQIGPQAPRVRVLLLGMAAEEASVARALAAGAHGALLADAGAPDLVRAVASLAAGSSYFCPAISQIILNGATNGRATDRPPDRYDALSNREREVLYLMATGRSNKEIADELSIALATVETHRARVFQKLQVHSIAELVLYAVRRGLVC
jgi:two-component system, NarL family, response regulator NreC